MCIHCLGHLSPHLLPPPFPPHPPRFQAEPVLPSSPILLKRRHSNNKKGIGFSLVWDMDSYAEIPSVASMHKCITTQIDSSLPDLFTTSQSPSHIDLCHFKVTVFTPLQWVHQTLSSFGFSTFTYSSCIHSPLSMWPMSSNITAFVLDLKSAYEGEHTIFGFLSLANFT
jgi:hypothetical protein